MIFEKLARLLQRYRLLSTLVFATISAVMVSFAVRARSDFTVQELFASADPEIAFLERFRAIYGADDDLIVLVVQAQDVFKGDVLKHIEELTRSLAALKVIRHVESLTTISDLGELGAGVIDTRAVYHDIPSDAKTAAARRRRVLGSPLLRGRVVSKDGTLATIGARLATGLVRARQMEQAVEKVERLLAAHRPRRACVATWSACRWCARTSCA